MLRLGFEYLSSLELTDFGTPVLERLRAATGLSTHLLIRDQRDVVFVAKAQTHEPMFSSVKVHVGTRLPAHATVHGHVLMGDLTLRRNCASSIPKPQARTVHRTHARHRRRTDESVRESAALGFGLSEASFERGISVVSAPVRDRWAARSSAAMTVDDAAFGYRSMPDEQEPLIDAVCQAALELSERLNYRPSGRSHCARRAASGAAG